MRPVAPFIIVLGLAGAAFAQGPPRVAIEDDVSPANAVKCAGLRLAQSERKPDPLVEAARDAWLLSSADLAVISDECEPFEIRSAPPAGG